MTDNRIKLVGMAQFWALRGLFVPCPNQKVQRGLTSEAHMQTVTNGIVGVPGVADRIVNLNIQATSTTYSISLQFLHTLNLGLLFHLVEGGGPSERSAAARAVGSPDGVHGDGSVCGGHAA